MTRALWATALTVTLLATPAAAQVGGGGRNKPSAPPKTDTTPKIDEKAYKAALERIPDSKEKYDPWGGVAPAAPAKKTK